MSIVVRFTYAANNFSDLDSDINAVFEVFKREGCMLNRISVLKFNMENQDLMFLVRMECSYRVLGQLLDGESLDFIEAFAKSVVITFWSFSAPSLSNYEVEMSKD